MVMRRHKIGAAAAVLLIGVCLAWPLRRQGGDGSPLTASPAPAVMQSAEGRARTPQDLTGKSAQGPAPAAGFAASLNPAAESQERSGAQSLELCRPIGAVVAAPELAQPYLASATLNQPAAPSTSPSTGGDGVVASDDPSAPRPIYATVDGAGSSLESKAQVPPGYRIHIVHQGDSLERLAARYLKDQNRALEIFNMNRETLVNPHLLPIGAELRIPAREDGDY